MAFERYERRRNLQQTIELRSADRRFGIALRASLVDELISHCVRKWPNETGGILVGRYTSSLDLAVVTRVLAPPPDSKHGRTCFVRGTRGLQELLRRLWRRPREAREYYLGEWHLHPGGRPAPSSTDRRQMTEVSALEGYHCPEPILLLVGGSIQRDWSFGAFVFPRGAGPVELLGGPS